MERTTKDQRKRNALSFCANLATFSSQYEAIHVIRNDGMRTQFVHYPSAMSIPMVIAESTGLGVEGCFIELIQFIKGGIRQVTFHEDGFYRWFADTMKLNCIYHDPGVFVFGIIR